MSRTINLPLRAIGALLKGPRTAGDVAAELDCGEASVRRLFNAGVTLNVLRIERTQRRGEARAKTGNLPIMYGLNKE